MKHALIAAAVLAVGILPAAAFTKAETDQLKTISGDTRLIQACTLEGLLKIAAEQKGMRPEHVIIDALSPASIKGDKLAGNGAAVRSRGKWYQLSFSCLTSPDHLEVSAFDYKVGEAVPEAKWAEFNLY
jgi:hypothetical protein